jgi:3-oxoacyl-[acyl-carrier-protein] synthase II
MTSTLEDPIVVTGMGVVSPLGCSVDGFWRRLVAGGSGLRRLPEEVVPDIDAKVGGVVPRRRTPMASIPMR